MVVPSQLRFEMATFTGIATFLALSTTLCLATSPRAHTPDATYKGTSINSAVDAFLGVPFAQPPVGLLRFAPPQAVRHEPKRIVDASSFGPVCHQFHYRTVLGENLVETTGQSEDCLTLNIFVPKQRRKEQLLPVYVWSYGGAFGEGGGSIPREILPASMSWSRCPCADTGCHLRSLQPRGVRRAQQGHHCRHVEVRS